MDKNFIEKIQKRVFDLLLTLSDSLQTAAKDQCSEMARLVGCWMLNEHPEYEAQIYKGILSDILAHDVLIIINNRKTLFIIDPTIWQIFPKSDSILVGSVLDQSGAINLLKKKYNGEWKISEIMQKCSDNYQQELLAVIEKKE
jgi:hypothetical protein